MQKRVYKGLGERSELLVIGAKGKERERGSKANKQAKTIFNESMAKNFTKLMKDFQSSDSVLSFDLGADYVSVYNL